MSQSRSDSLTNFATPSLVAMDDDPRQLAGKLVNALYRVVKSCQLHSESNNAVAQVVDYAMATVLQYFEKTGINAFAILFTPHAVFVNRSMLKTSRETYQLALELGKVLQECDVTEITITREVTANEIIELGRVVADYSQTGRKSPKFAEGGWQALTLRCVVGFGTSLDMSPPVRAARTFAAALMIVRKFYEDLKGGSYEVRQGIKRVAQKLVSSFDADSPGSKAGSGRLLLSIAAAPSGDADRASVLLSGAIIALAMANQLTNDRTLLTALASAALLYDAGRQRLLGYDREGEPLGPRVLNADQESLLPVSSVVALTAMGKLHPPSIARTVIVHEAQAIRDGAPLYQGRRSPLLLSRILAVAFAFTELRVPRAGAGALGIDDALQVLESQAPDNVGRALVKALTGALGIFPAGTMVELSTGEMGVVLATPVLPVDFARPPVRVLYDTQAQLLSEPLDIDLAAPSKDGLRRHIRRPIDATDQQMKQMRAYVMQLATKRAKKKTMDRLQAVKDAPPARASAPDPSGPSTDGYFGASSSLPMSSGAIGSSSSMSSGFGSGQSSGSVSGARPSDVAPPSSRPHHASISGAPPPSGAPPSSEGHSPDSLGRRAVRPATRRWDPRTEEAGMLPAQKPRGLVAPRPTHTPPHPPPTPQSPHETRSLSWQEYNKELAVSVGKPPPSAPPVSAHDSVAPSSEPRSETDAILAAYLAEASESADPSSSQGDRPSARAGLRWTGTGRNSPDSSQGRPSSSGDGPISSSAGLRWGGSNPRSSSGRDSYSSTPPPASPFAPSPTGPSPISAGLPPISALPSSPRGRSAAPPSMPAPAPTPNQLATPPLSARPVPRVSTGAWAAGPRKTGPDPSPFETPTVAAECDPPVPPASASVPETPHSKRAKAGTASWGSKKK